MNRLDNVDETLRKAVQSLYDGDFTRDDLAEDLEAAHDDLRKAHAELERLQNLERKIEAFFGMMDVRNLDEGAAIDIRRQVDGKWYDVYVERGTSHWLAVKDFGLQFEVSKHEALGDAMRKAFELFEVPKEAEG